MLEISNIEYNYADFSLSNVSLHLEEGELGCVLGASGCGKSTLLRLIAGIEGKCKGVIRIDNVVVNDKDTYISPQDRSVGIVFQGSSLFPNKTVIENVKLAMSGHYSSAGKDFKSRELLTSVGMCEHCEKYPHEISGGQQQRAMIARVLAYAPKVVLLDEPFANLDYHTRNSVRDFVFGVLKSRGITSLLVTHNPEEALEIADKIYLIKDGKILQSGAPLEIYCSPIDNVVANFFSELVHLKDVYVVDNFGYIDTIIGKIKVTNASYGDEVSVCFRPDAVCSDNESVIKAEVLDVKFRHCYIRILNDKNVYRIKMSVAFLPKKGDIMGISIDFNQLFIFNVCNNKENVKEVL